MGATTATMPALLMFLMGTAAILLYTVAWAFSSCHPVPRPHTHLTGRPAVPYWYSPTGHQDERGIPRTQ